MDELKGKIRARGKTYADIALDLGMGINTLSNKLNGSSAFNSTEIELLAKILKLSNDELIACFFPSRMGRVS